MQNKQIMTIDSSFARGAYQAPVCEIVVVSAAESLLQGSPLQFGNPGGAGGEQGFNEYDLDF